MKIKELSSKTNKVHYMLRAIFDNEDFDQDIIEIAKITPNHFYAKLIDDDPTFCCDVEIVILDNLAKCHIMPADHFCDESVFTFKYSQNIPMYYEIAYC